MTRPDIRTKLAKVLALLGSDQEGERAAAGLAAAKMVRDAGLTWVELLTPAASPSRVVELRPAGVGIFALPRAKLLSLMKRMSRMTYYSDAERKFLLETHQRIYQRPDRGITAGEAQALDKLLFGRRAA